MAKLFLTIYSLIFFCVTLLKVLLYDRKAKKGGSILYDQWVRTVSTWGVLGYGTLIFLLAYTIGYKLHGGYTFVLAYGLSIVVMVVSNSRLILTDEGISFKNDYTKWHRVYQIEYHASYLLINTKKPSFLSSGYKTIKLPKNDELIAIIRSKNKLIK